jgi:hypothetical protein
LLLVQSYAPDKAPCINCLEQSPSQLASTFRSWFFLLLVWLSLSFIQREDLLLCSSYLPLGVPNWVPNMQYQCTTWKLSQKLEKDSTINWSTTKMKRFDHYLKTTKKLSLDLHLRSLYVRMTSWYVMIISNCGMTILVCLWLNHIVWCDKCLLDLVCKMNCLDLLCLGRNFL